jgi:hypothetical protein
MHSKSVASLVVLMALAFGSSSALAATDRAGEVSSSSAKTKDGAGHSQASGSRHSPRRKPSKKRSAGAIVARGDKRRVSEVASHGHPAEPTRTPAVAASMGEPMVVRADVKKTGPHAGTRRPDSKVIPAIDRGVTPKPRRVVHSKAKEALDASEEKGGDVTVEPQMDVKPDEHGERHLLTRTSAAEGPAPQNRAAKILPKATLPKPPCFHETVLLTRGQETDQFPLSKCDGELAPFAVERLSILVRPESAQKPLASLDLLVKAKGVELAPGVRKVDPGLIGRLQQIVDRFGKTGSSSHVSIVSGYRPNSTGSYHATGQALDMRLDGVKNEELVEFCETLPDTGCGYYPNSSFVHVDVRAPGTGHVHWIDASGPGESPRYVSSWPPPADPPALPDSREASAKVISKLDRELPPLPVDVHPAAPDAPAASVGEPLDEKK